MEPLCLGFKASSLWEGTLCLRMGSGTSQVSLWTRGLPPLEKQKTAGASLTTRSWGRGGEHPRTHRSGPIRREKLMWLKGMWLRM